MSGAVMVPRLSLLSTCRGMERLSLPRLSDVDFVSVDSLPAMAWLGGHALAGKETT